MVVVLVRRVKVMIVVAVASARLAGSESQVKTLGKSS